MQPLPDHNVRCCYNLYLFSFASQGWSHGLAIQTVNHLQLVVTGGGDEESLSVFVVRHTGDFISARDHRTDRGCSRHREIHHGLLGLEDFSCARQVVTVVSSFSYCTVWKLS